jgi:ribosome-binding ATPase YchF (GTP1/OBG family)
MRARERVEGDEVELRGLAAQQLRERASLRTLIVHAIEHHVLEGDAASVLFIDVVPAGLEQLGEVPIVVIEKGKAIGSHSLSGAMMNPQPLRELFLLTAKPAMALVNLDEGQLEDPEPLLEPVRQAMGTISGVPAQDTVVGLCIQLEAEAALLDPESRTEMLEALGMGDGALPQFLHGAYAMLGLRTFFTTGEKESRAWTFRAGYKAPQAAGVIHTDFERGFIRAETIDWQELLEAGSWSAARDAGTLRVEGKDYEVADGDVMEFRFNV